MRATGTEIADLLVIEPEVFEDARGHFFESWNAWEFEKVTGINPRFVQDNHSFSSRGVLRGLHYQIRQPQGKLVRVVSGSVFDVAVDLRRSSATFGRWCGHELSASNRRQLWIPPGLAHGFLVMSEGADFIYKATDYYSREHERCLAWNDPAIGVRWPIEREPTLSARDRSGTLLKDAEVYP